MGDKSIANGDSVTKERRRIGPRRIGMSEGIDLDATVEEGQGWFGSLRGANLPELGPFTDEAKTLEALSRVACVYRRHGSDPEKTIGSAEYLAILHDYGLGYRQETD